jgi:hypothetical protein
MTPADVQRLLQTIERTLEGVPPEVGRSATDTDSGVIRIQPTAGIQQVRFEGAYRNAKEFAEIYSVVDMILASVRGERQIEHRER